MKYIDYYFSPGTWIFPRDVFLKENGGKGKVVKNQGLRIKADFLDPDHQRLWGNYYYENWNKLGIVDNGKLYPTLIETENLLRVIQYRGINERGFLRGTYKMTRVEGKCYDVYRLVPEGSMEEDFKEDVTRVYNDPAIPNTLKMIPGHLYLSEYGELWLCLSGVVDNYCQSRYGYYIDILAQPRKEKALLRVTSRIKPLLDRYPIKTLSDFVREVYIPYDLTVDFRSPRFSGKDLGEIYKPEDMVDYMHSNIPPEDIQTSILLLNKIWKTNEGLKKELINRVTNLYTIRTIPQSLKNDLGI